MAGSPISPSAGSSAVAGGSDTACDDKAMRSASGNVFRASTQHSAEYFGDTRDHWWNQDYIELMAKRLDFGQVQDVLDVGCGVGHWGQLLATVLPSNAHVRGIDAEPRWIREAATRSTVHRLPQRFDYQVASAERLPFEDSHFDLVTCQTVLIHMRDPGAVIGEMIRVARPGGLILAVEPNNVVTSLVQSSLSFEQPIDDLISVVRFQLICERGKAALGEGHNSAGDIVPGLFAAHGLKDIRVYLSDKAPSMLPPYDSAAERAAREEDDDLQRRNFWIWSRDDTLRYFAAGGGAEPEFEAAWRIATSGTRETADAIAKGTYAYPGGGVMYLVAARK